MNCAWRVVRITFCVLVLAMPSLRVAAQDFPNRPVKVVVPFTAGGDVDTFGRLLADKFKDRLGQVGIVENRTGGGGLVAWPTIVNAAPDGYTVGLFVYTVGQFPALIKAFPADWYQRITPVTMTHSMPVALLASTKAPIKTLAELLAYAKANPGKLNFAGLSRYLPIELFQQLAGIQLTQVPYKGTADAQAAILAGEVDLGAYAIASSRSLIQGGRVIPIVILADARSPHLAGVPAAAELIPGYQLHNWFGLLAPPGTPRPIVGRLYEAVSASLRAPDVQKFFNDNSAEIINSPPDQMARFLEEDTRKWLRVAREAKIEPQ